MLMTVTQDAIARTFSTASGCRARDALGCSAFRTLLLETGFGTPSRSFTDGRGGGTFSCLPCNIHISATLQQYECASLWDVSTCSLLRANQHSVPSLCSQARNEPLPAICYLLSAACLCGLLLDPVNCSYIKQASLHSHCCENLKSYAYFISMFPQPLTMQDCKTYIHKITVIIIIFIGLNCN
jgi:hypothetical protein